MSSPHETTTPFSRVLPVPGQASARISHYVVESELGRGGMGVVYRALDTNLGRRVALKMILDPRRAGPEELERFQREARAAARLRHPAIVQVHEAGVHEGRPYLALELVEGESFDALLKRTAVPPRRVAEIVLGLARALAYAHGEGVIHRDVKPQNVLVDQRGEPHLMDFGLAREEAATAELTRTGDVLGTPAYMAPEQATGDPRAQGPHTDVYAIGAVLYRALAGRPPFEAPQVQGLLYKVLTEEPKPLRAINASVHADLETIALRCLEKAPAKRYPTAGDVALDLERFLAGEPIAARPPGPRERLVRWVRKNRALAAASSTLALALVLGGALVVAKSIHDERTRVAALTREKQVAREETRGRVLEAWRDFRSARRDELHHRFSPARVTSQEGSLTIAGARLLVLQEEWQKLAGGEPAGPGARSFDDACFEVGAAFEDTMHYGLARDCYRQVSPARGAERDRAVEAARSREARELQMQAAIGHHLLGVRGVTERRLTSLLDEDPRSVLGHVVRGRQLVTTSQYDDAVVDFTAALELLPEPSCAVLVDRAEARLRSGSLALARKDCDAALALDEAFTHALKTRAEVALAEHDYRGAVADFDRVLADRTYVLGSTAAIERAQALYLSGERERAEQDLTKVIESDDANVAAHAFRAGWRAARGDRAGAIADGRAFIEAVPPGPEAEAMRRRLAELEAGR